jgi:hypothetical protein
MNAGCGPWLASDAPPKRPCSCGVISRAVTNAAAAPIETFARYDQGPRQEQLSIQENLPQ